MNKRVAGINGNEGRWLNTEATILDFESLVTISIPPQIIFLSFIISSDRKGCSGRTKWHRDDMAANKYIRPSPD